jgi:DNA-binding NarL/FixJ family response regulator
MQGRLPEQGRSVNSTNDSRVLVISEKHVWNEDIVKAIRVRTEVDIVIVAGRGINILKEVRNANPDIVLTDRTSIMVEVLKAFPRLKVIGVHVSRSQPDILECVKAGVSGFILENASQQELLKTIRSVSQGRKVLPAALADVLFYHVAEQARRSVEPMCGVVQLTRREREISLMIAEGLSNKEIAQRLIISTFTVKSHVHNILEKLGLHRRMHIMLKCRSEELNRVPDDRRGRAVLPMARRYQQDLEQTENVSRQWIRQAPGRRDVSLSAAR